MAQLIAPASSGLARRRRPVFPVWWKEARQEQDKVRRGTSLDACSAPEVPRRRGCSNSRRRGPVAAPSSQARRRTNVGASRDFNMPQLRSTFVQEAMTRKMK